MESLPNIETSSFEELKKYYDTILNKDKEQYKSRNDEPTPIDCILDMINKIPTTFWSQKDIKILDPCCGNGNFFIPIYFKLLENKHKKHKILSNILHFNDINEERLTNVKKVFCNAQNITNHDYIKVEVDPPSIQDSFEQKYDLIVANPPYAKYLESGKRASKNHNLIQIFLERTLSLLKEGGYLLFITPDNWMSYADRNKLIEKLTQLQIIHLDIHTAKKYFKKIGSSFTWYVIQNVPYYKDICVSGIWKNCVYYDTVKSMKRKYIPQLYNQIIQNILSKTIDNEELEKFKVMTSSDLHRYTKTNFISKEQTDVYKYRLIHTPKQIVYSSRPHKYQEGYKVFISTTDKYKVFVDNCGMTQSIVFILCDSQEQANKYVTYLQHPLYRFLNNICRWGNFNNIRILQHLPKPIDCEDIYKYFQITKEEILFIENHHL
jgi:adenine-specific DNA-methyltransferase